MEWTLTIVALALIAVAAVSGRLSAPPMEGVPTAVTRTRGPVQQPTGARQESAQIRRRDTR